MAALADQEHKIRLEALEGIGELDNAEADGLGHGARDRSLELHVYLIAHGKAVFLHHLLGQTEPIQ
jgi:hypothetical protein